MSARPRDETGGFTLIEVLVAFVVLATLLGVLYRGVVGLHLASNAFDDHTDRELVARAVLDEALADRGLKPGVHHGSRDGRRWTIIAKAIDLTAQLPKPADADEPKPAAGQQPGQPSQPSGQPAQPDQPKDKPEWATQRLIVRIDSPGRPLQIETLRIVRAEQ